MANTLEVENLKTYFSSKAGDIKAVDGVSFSIAPGQVMGLVGESGSGKSITGYSILGLIDEPGKVVGGTIMFKGDDLRTMDEAQLERVRGNRISMIFQDPMMTLNPVLRIDTQMIEAILAHRKMSKDAARQIAREALVSVGIPSPDERLVSYPHQFSGGMRQRVAIAIALLNKPDLIIADEPTTALDVTIQAQILFQTQQLCEQSGTSLIWITHDLSVVAGLADQICVMYAGRIVEKGSVLDVLGSPKHPYTRGLLDSAPSRNIRGLPLKQIPGNTQSAATRPEGCAFRTRCAFADAACLVEPPSFGEGHEYRCFHPLS